MQFNQIAHGGDTLVPYHVTFTQAASSALEDQSDVSFDVQPESLPLTNVHVLTRVHVLAAAGMSAGRETLSVWISLPRHPVTSSTLSRLSRASVRDGAPPSTHSWSKRSDPAWPSTRSPKRMGGRPGHHCCLQPPLANGAAAVQSPARPRRDKTLPP